jgi:hypothetical protein
METDLREYDAPSSVGLDLRDCENNPEKALKT